MLRIYEQRAYGSEPNAGNFWQTTVANRPEFAPATGDISCDFAIIGGGFTGLNAALELAGAGADVVVLEAEQPGWGASGRNGGFCCIGGDKLSPATLIRRYGEEDARCYFRAQRAAIDHVAAMLDHLEIDADRHSDGETLLAHRPRDAEAFPDDADALFQAYGIRSQIWSKQDLAENGLSGPEFHGAMTLPLGFALNPLKYASGLANAAQNAGVRVFGNSAVRATAPVVGGWRLAAGEAVVQAKTLIIATNGYSSENVPAWMAGRYLPVQSSILVTRPLTQQEQTAQGYFSTQMCYDSRNLLHYFRLMPDGRFLFGMRGAVRADHASNQALTRQIRADFERMFPAWAHIETPHFWSGLACISKSRTPFAGPLGDLPNAYGAFAYHGNGVAMGSYAGRLVASLALGRKGTYPHPAFMRKPPARFPLGRYRRTLLHVAYRWYAALDR